MTNTTDSGSEERFSIDPDSKPYSHLGFKNDPDEFQFAVLADNAGGARPGVVSAGLEKLNLLHPEFVVNLGDLIEGYIDPKDQTPATVDTYRAWWEEWDGYLTALEAPFFYVPGNHDLNNPPSVEVWKERFGGTRQYSHFRYKDTLFLIVSTEDPPKDTDALLETDPEYAAEIDQAYNAAKKAAHEGAPLDHIIELLTPVEEFAGKINISGEQVDYFRTVLADNQDVRWTFVLMHSPAWWTQTGYEIDPGNFTLIEKELSDRDYTVFAAHTHLYRHHQRHGRDYITAAMTGALQVPQLGAIDHVIWITMTKTGPKIANLL
ncbi:MAG: metallophosphoesterase family protein, partial [Acidimicrobiia bacterium]